MSVTISDRDRLGVVGINGTGKSTLLRVLAGSQRPESGVVRRGRGVRVGVLDQDAPLRDAYSAGRRRRGVGAGGDPGPPRYGRLDGAAGVGAVRRSGEAGGIGRGARAVQRSCSCSTEPTNHLDLPAIAWLEAWLSTLPRWRCDREPRPAPSRQGHNPDARAGPGQSLRSRRGLRGIDLASKAERAERAASAEAVRTNLAWRGSSRGLRSGCRRART